MDLQLGVCSICRLNDKILRPADAESYTTNIGATFFENHEQELAQFQKIKDTLKLCVFCSFKLDLSHRFKEQFEKAVNRQMDIKKSVSECFVCDAKDYKLVKTDSDPNHFYSRMKVFMGSVLTPRPFQQCAICMYCLYHFSVWFELRAIVFDMFEPNVEEVPKIAVRQRTRPRKIVGNNLLPKNNPNEFLKRLLTKLNSLRLQKQFEINDVCKNDKKIFEQIPYVLITNTSQVTKTNLKPTNSSESIDLTTDSDENAKNSTKNTPKKSLSLPIPAIQTPVNAKQPIFLKPRSLPKMVTSKTYYKIKFKTSKRRMSAPPPKLNFTQTFVCYICSKHFEKSYDYKAHLLMHERPEKIVINVTRERLPERSLVSEFMNKAPKPQSPSVSIEEQKRLLVKYIGESALDVFKDTEEPAPIVEPMETSEPEVTEESEKTGDPPEDTTEEDDTQTIESDSPVENSSEETSEERNSLEINGVEKLPPEVTEEESTEKVPENVHESAEKAEEANKEELEESVEDTKAEQETEDASDEISETTEVKDSDDEKEEKEDETKTNTEEDKKGNEESTGSEDRNGNEDKADRVEITSTNGHAEESTNDEEEFENISTIRAFINKTDTDLTGKRKRSVSPPSVSGETEKSPLKKKVRFACEEVQEENGSDTDIHLALSDVE